MNNAGTAFNRFRYDPAFQRGFEAGGRLLAEGSAVLGRYGRPVPEAPYNPESELETAMDQESDLENWARKNGCWHIHPQEYYKSLGYQFYGFGGDANEFSKWVNSHLVYPEKAKKNGIQGRVTLQYTIDIDGSVKNVKVLRGIEPSLDKEAVRVVSSSPKWKPGKSKNQPVPLHILSL